MLDGRNARRKTRRLTKLIPRRKETKGKGVHCRGEKARRRFDAPLPTHSGKNESSSRFEGVTISQEKDNALRKTNLS